jgi:eukaryotic-like serine/threonine-protein kinase
MGLTELLPGDPQRIGHHRLLARLGSGGMGTVYLARTPQGRQVAIKVLRADNASSPQLRSRFAREAQALTMIQSDLTARVLEAVVDAPVPYLVTEYIQGPTLAEHVEAAGPLPPVLLHGLAAGLAAALTAIHRADVVHRDLKPSNVILAPDGPKVIDFGIAVPEGATALTQTGALVGTPGFMAPEQITGQAGRPADVFNWALTVAYGATGRQPFGTGTTAAVLYRVVHDEPDLAGVPEQARPILAAALAKDPAQRPTAAQVLAHLVGPDRAPEELPDVTTSLLARTWQYQNPLPPTPLPPLPPLRRQARAWAPLAVAALVALGLIGGSVLLRLSSASPPATPTHPPADNGPSTRPATTPPPATKVLTFQPWSDTTLSADETVLSTVNGSCWTSSGAASRSDAYRCMTGNNIYDPCFTGPAQNTEVACPVSDPKKVIVIKLTQALPYNGISTTPPPLTPWLVVLSDGQNCVFETGMGVGAADSRQNFLCPHGAIYGMPTSGVTWTASYQQTGTSALSTVPIATVYE